MINIYRLASEELPVLMFLYPRRQMKYSNFVS
jgi:hypothetical protein